MLDLETLGTDSNSVITTISAVQFNLGTGEIGSEFQVAVDWQEQLDNGAVVNMETIRFWLSQSKEAISQMLIDEPLSVESACQKFDEWVHNINITEPQESSLWGNGATFDNVILRNLYQRHNLIFPFPFWADKDVRTLVQLSGVNIREIEFKGIKHYGIDDCKHQIKYCHTCFKSLKS